MLSRIRLHVTKPEGGFTLMEVMVVLGILAILAVIAVPSYIKMLPDKRLKTAARDIKSDMELLKMRAIRENADAVIWFDKNNDNYLAYLDQDGNRSQGAGEPTLISGEIHDDVDMYNTLFSSWSNQTVFDARGFPSGGWGYVDMVNTKGNYRRVVLSLAGLIKIQRSSDGSTWTDAP